MVGWDLLLFFGQGRDNMLKQWIYNGLSILIVVSIVHCLECGENTWSLSYECTLSDRARGSWTGKYRSTQVIRDARGSLASCHG